MMQMMSLLGQMTLPTFIFNVVTEPRDFADLMTIMRIRGASETVLCARLIIITLHLVWPRKIPRHGHVCSLVLELEWQVWDEVRSLQPFGSLGEAPLWLCLPHNHSHWQALHPMISNMTFKMTYYHSICIIIWSHKFLFFLCHTTIFPRTNLSSLYLLSHLRDSLGMISKFS